MSKQPQGVSFLIWSNWVVSTYLIVDSTLRGGVLFLCLLPLDRNSLGGKPS